MSSVVLTGSTSGSVTVQAAAVAGSNTATIGAATGTHFPFTAGTAVASTSGTSIDFTGIPSWVKRITVMFNGVSLSGTSSLLVQIGSGSVASSGYTSSSGVVTASNTTGVLSSTAGFIVWLAAAANAFSGTMTINLLSSNTYNSSHSGKMSTALAGFGGGDVALSGTLDRIRITTVNGTDTFDAGSINILYE